MGFKYFDLTEVTIAFELAMIDLRYLNMDGSFAAP